MVLKIKLQNDKSKKITVSNVKSKIPNKEKNRISKVLSVQQKTANVLIPDVTKNKSSLAQNFKKYGVRRNTIKGQVFALFEKHGAENVLFETLLKVAVEIKKNSAFNGSHHRLYYVDWIRNNNLPDLWNEMAKKDKNVKPLVPRKGRKRKNNTNNKDNIKQLTLKIPKKLNI